MLSRTFWLFAVIVALTSVLEIALSSPLFATLGFEYSALMALALSLVSGLYALNSPSSERGGGWGIVFSGAAILSLIPLVISILSLPFIPNCSLLDGLVFYIEIAIPSALLGAGFGFVFSMLARSRKLALWLFIGFWILTLVLSLLPGYTNPQLYTYGWQYGFFPGLTWDESIELTNGYLYFRLENVVWLVLLLPLSQRAMPNRPARFRYSLVTGMLITAISMYAKQDRFHVTTSHRAVQAKLTRQIAITPDCVVHCDPQAMTDDEVAQLVGDVRWYLHDIREKYQLREKQPISIYIYPSTESLFALIGTRTASISKPWLSELHIAKENLHSLKHELAHVLLREKGSWPFYASWSTGLTEGAAMAVEYDYDGIFTLDEHAANILRLGYAKGVSSVMAFTGFAANASQKSYVLAGSFSRYLLAAYGPERFTRVYASLSFEKEYGKPLDSIEAEWKRWLVPLERPLTADDSAHFRYYYDRTSIIFRPCLRRIGKLQRQAAIAYREKRYADAQELYADAVREGGGLSALVMESYVMMRRDNIRGAQTLLDTIAAPWLWKQRAALYNQKADLNVLTNSEATARQCYDSAMLVKLNATSFLNAWLMSTLSNSPSLSNHELLRTLVYSSYDPGDSVRRRVIDSLSRIFLYSSFEDAYLGSIATDELRFKLLLRNGALQDAKKGDILESWLRQIPVISAADSLALTLMDRERLRFDAEPAAGRLCPIPYQRADREVREEFERRRAAGF